MALSKRTMFISFSFLMILFFLCSDWIFRINFGKIFRIDQEKPKDPPIPCVFNKTKWSRSTTYPPYYIDINKYDLSNFTFITGASSNHFKESKDLIASIQKHFPHKTIYYYDLGLDKNQVEQLRNWCNVYYIKWHVRTYPKHVWTIKYYAFKSLVIYDAILRFDAVFWLDASGRLSTKVNQSNWGSVYDTARITYGIVMFVKSRRDTFQCTNKGMYRYLPADEEKLKRLEMLGSGAVLLYRTENVFNKILVCWRLCGLTKECNQPKGHRKSCGQPKPHVSVCHRYDQSSLNILVAKYLNYENKHVHTGEPIIIIRRSPTELYSLMTNCSVL